MSTETGIKDLNLVFRKKTEYPPIFSLCYFSNAVWFMACDGVTACMLSTNV